MYRLKTPAKINLVLEVTGKRPDGYHEIKSIIQAIDMYDEMSFEHAPSLEFEYNIPGLKPNNLITRAAQLLKDASGYRSGAIIRLKKGIPVSGGLGGGSSDAAATLKGLTHLWKLGLDEAALMELAARLGSDVPFFIHGGTAFAEGRGEVITRLPALTGYWVVFLMPDGKPVENKTAAMYSKLTPSDYTDGSSALKMASAIRENNRLDMSLLFNVFNLVAGESIPGVAEGFSRMAEAGATHVHLAGSGPTVFTLTEDKRKAEKMIYSLKRLDALGSYLLCQFTDK